jgi:hypothetical protein
MEPFEQRIIPPQKRMEWEAELAESKALHLLGPKQ